VFQFSSLNFLFDAFKNNSFELFYVGGFVRDKTQHEMSSDPRISDITNLQPFNPNDIDLATNAHPNQISKILSSLKLPVIPIGIKFGTIGSIIDDRKIEITTYRCKESYQKGNRKPDVVFGTILKEDLSRRDFTMNAMAMDQNGTLIDPWYGYADLIMGLLITPIAPSISFSDDPLRMMRAFRFVSQDLGAIEYTAGEAISKLKDSILSVSPERIVDEMNKILIGRSASKALEQMGQSGLLGVIFPELQKVIDFKQNQGIFHSKKVWPHTLDVVKNSPAKLELRWAALFHDVAKPETYSENESGVHFYCHEIRGSHIWRSIADRLKMSHMFRDHVELLIKEHLSPGLLTYQGVNHCSKTALRRFIYRAEDKLDDIFKLSLADITSHKPEVVLKKTQDCLALKERVSELAKQEDIPRIKLPKGTGLLIAKHYNLVPGPYLGTIMDYLKQELIDGTITENSNFVQEAGKHVWKS